MSIRYIINKYISKHFYGKMYIRKVLWNKNSRGRMSFLFKNVWNCLMFVWIRKINKVMLEESRELPLCRFGLIRSQFEFFLQYLECFHLIAKSPIILQIWPSMYISLYKCKHFLKHLCSCSWLLSCVWGPPRLFKSPTPKGT